MPTRGNAVPNESELDKAQRSSGSTGHFGASPTMMNPKTNPKPPAQGPKGGAGDSGAAEKTSAE